MNREDSQSLLHNLPVNSPVSLGFEGPSQDNRSDTGKNRNKALLFQYLPGANVQNTSRGNVDSSP